MMLRGGDDGVDLGFDCGRYGVGASDDDDTLGFQAFEFCGDGGGEAVPSRKEEWATFDGSCCGSAEAVWMVGSCCDVHDRYTWREGRG